MAQSKSDLFSKLSDRGEDVVGKISDMPAAQRIFDAGMQLKARVDDMQKKMRGLEELERRVKALEKKVDELSRASGGAKAAATPKPTTQAKPKTSS